MTQFLSDHYLWLKALHVISVISWMAGMLYLPRLFVYHVGAVAGSDKDATFKIMEKKLLRIILTPAMLATFLFGILMIVANPSIMSEPWMHMKVTSVLLLAGLHGFFAGCVRKFANNANTRSAKFYRMINEVPAVLMIVIVIMVIVKPF